MNPIRKYRLQNRMTQDELAGMVGVDRSNVAKWEAGVHKPRMDLLLPISKALNCSVEDLLKEWEEVTASHD